MNKRGYTYEQVRQQIEKRRNDYETYIAPLKKNANIISNGYDYDDVILKCKTLL